MRYRPQRRFSFAHPELDLEVQEEIDLHLDLSTEELIAEGFDPPSAREEAERRFGDPETYRQACREARAKRHRRRRRREWSLGLVSDFKLAWRTLTRSPGFATVAVATLALGIGSTTVLTSIVDGVLLAPLPYPEPGRLMALFETSGEYQHVPASPANFADWRDRSRSFEALAAFVPGDFTLTGAGDPVRLRGKFVGEGFFDVLGVSPASGRTFTSEEATRGDQLAVLSYGMWQSHLGARQDALGSTLQLSGKAFTVIGVMPPEFDPTPRSWLWAPLGELPDARGPHYLEVIGRLKPGVPRSVATAELETLAANLAAEYPDTNKGSGINAMALDLSLVEEVRPTLWTLLAAVVAVLVIGCVNVANLTLARSSLRRRELAVRSALGSGSGGLVRLLVTESLLVAALGGVAGVVLAWVGLRVGLNLVPGGVPRLESVSLDLRILGLACLASIASGFLFGFLPAWWMARGNLNSELGSGRNPGLSVAPKARFLVAAEVALALVMVMAAGLLLRSFERVLAIDGGFDAENLLTLKIQLPGDKYEEQARQSAFYEELIERARSLPGVRSAAVIPWLPLEPGWNLGFEIDGRPKPEPGERPWAMTRWVSSGYFETLGIPMHAGRDFNSGDLVGSQGVVVVNRELARVYFPDEDPVGKILHYDVVGADGLAPRRVVGVVGDVRQSGLTRGIKPTAYIPQTQESFWSMTLAVKTSTPPLELADAVRREIWAMDPLLAVDDVRTMEQRYQAQLEARRFTMRLVSAFALVALGLAALGTYGVIAQLVARRTAEIGVRVALGASARDVVRWALGHGVKMVAAGVLVGLGAAFALTRWLESLLYETSTTDPLTFAGVVVVLMAVAMLACLLPARRATRVDPVVALRSE